MSERQKKALLVVNAFPPLIKNAGGVSKRYFTLCRALIDDLGYQVTILTPVDIRKSQEEDIHRWLREDKLQHLGARGVRITSEQDGVAVFLDLYSFINTGFLLNELALGRPGQGGYDIVFMDDVPWRLQMLLLSRAFGIPAVVSSHTDVTHMKSYKGVVKLVWNVHMLSTHLAAVHATVSKVFGTQLVERYGVPAPTKESNLGLWPPILWSKDFKDDIPVWAERAAKTRQRWMDLFKQQGFTPKYIFMFAGRWSAEKRVNLLWEVIPDDCGLVIVGDGTAEAADQIAAAGKESGRKNVLPLRKMLNSADLRESYAAADLFLSASNFETLGNTVVEAWCSGTPVAIQPAQGHLEFVVDGVNSWFVDYDKPEEARQKLKDIASKKLGAEHIGQTMPECLKKGKHLRQTPFAEELDKQLIQPALAVGRNQRVLGNFFAPIEIMKRVLAFMSWLILWIVLRTFNRVVYIFSKNPEMEVLGKLGGAQEVADKAKVGDVGYKEMYGAAQVTKYRCMTRSGSQGDLNKKK